MSDYSQYGYEQSQYSSNVDSLINDIESSSKYDIVISNSYSNSFLSIKENGDITLLADDMLGIKIIREGSKISMFGGEISQNADHIGINSSEDVFIGNNLVADGSSVSIAGDSVNIYCNNISVNGTPLQF